MTDNTQLALLSRSRRPKKHAHRFVIHDFVTQPGHFRCDLCGITRADYEARQRRGRLNRTRGQRIQRQRINGLGGRNLAGNNPSLDGMGAMFAAEVKSTKRFPEVFWRYLKGIKLITSEQVPILIVTEAGSIGRKARSIVVLDYESWKELHGETREATDG